MTRPAGVLGGVAAAGAASGAAWAATRPAVKALGESVSRMAGGENRWLTVTVNCPPERLADGRLPGPVARLAGQAEVRVRPAPGGRGTELALRLTTPPPGGARGLMARVQGSDPRQELRSALRDAKSLVETGEVIQPDDPGSTHPTAAGKLFDLALRVAGGEGRL